MTCDLHTHSIYSDGSFTPAEIISHAKALGLAAVALTDHNTVAGLTEFLAEGKRQNVTAVAGTELSTVCGEKELHVVGLFIPEENYGGITRLTEEFRQLKIINTAETVRRLREGGYEIDYETVFAYSPNENPNRAHVAAELFRKGYVASVTEAFNTVLREGGGFYVPPRRLETEAAVSALRDLGALPLLAHPLQDLSPVETRKILPRLISAGLMGMETLHSSYSTEDIRIAEEIAKEFSLLPSGGSDFHGTVKPDVALGSGRGNVSVPYGFYENLLAASTAL